MYRETPRRLAFKALSHYTLSSFVTAVLVILFTNRLETAILIGVIDALFKVSVYFLHDQLWEKIEYGRSRIKPTVIWLTGLSGSGKTTLAKGLSEQLKEEGHLVQHIDHDTVREVFPEFENLCANSAQSTQAIGYVAHCLEKNGITVVASISAPQRDSRNFARRICRNFREIHVSTPAETCAIRDQHHPKTGHSHDTSDKYEPPLTPDLRVDTAVISNGEAIQKIMETIQGNQQIPVFVHEDAEVPVVS